MDAGASCPPRTANCPCSRVSGCSGGLLCISGACQRIPTATVELESERRLPTPPRSTTTRQDAGTHDSLPETAPPPVDAGPGPVETEMDAALPSDAATPLPPSLSATDAGQ